MKPRRPAFRVRTAARAALALSSALAIALPSLTARAHAPADPLHGGQGAGVRVVGHTDLGGRGLNADVAVLGDYAYVGAGTNGGFAAQWNNTPRCKEATASPTPVKVVSLTDPAEPRVVAEILIGDRRFVARDVSVLRVERRSPTNVFAGDLLAVAVEACQLALGARGGFRIFDISNPSLPIPLGVYDAASATREVDLVQRADGRVLAIAANQGGAIAILDVTVPLVPLPLGTYSVPFTFSNQECRPFAGLPEGVSFNADGTRAYVAYMDSGLHVLDLSNPAAPAVLAKMAYPESDEGNSLRFLANAGESAAVATDDDIVPARTTVRVNGGGPAAEYTEPGGTTPGVFRGCEAVWGTPLFQRETPSTTADVAYIPNFGCDPALYAGRDVRGKIVLTDRGGSGFESPGSACAFDEKARRAQEAGAVALLIGNNQPDYHIEGATGRLLSPDSVFPGDAAVTIPVAMITQEARGAMRQVLDAGGSVNVTFGDAPDTWGVLRVIGLTPAGVPSQVAEFTTPRSRTLTPGSGRYNAVQAIWEGDSVLATWMSDGLRVVDLSDPASPRARAYYVPPAHADPTNNYGAVPLVVGVARHGSNVVITDINGGLYVLDVALGAAACDGDGWARYGFADQADCLALFA